MRTFIIALTLVVLELVQLPVAAFASNTTAVISELAKRGGMKEDEARKALADHRKLWGLDAPQKVDVRASRNPYEGMTEDALRAELARQTRLLGEPAAGTPEPLAADHQTAIQPEPINADHS